MYLMLKDKRLILRVVNNFYRATRMHTADYAVVRCLSVRHTPVLCVNGLLYPQSFSPSGSPTILVFPDQMEWQYSDGDLPNGGVECKGGMKNHDFRQYRALFGN